VLGNFGGRTAITYTIDEPTGRLANTSAIPEGNAEVMDLAYSYDPAGNLIRIADSPGATLPVETQCFRYDHLRRLVTAWTPLSKAANNCQANPGLLGGPAKYWHDYEYDAVGNRTKLVDHATGLAGVGPGVGPFEEHGALVAFDLPVGAGPIGAGSLVHDAGLGEHAAPEAGSVARSIVGQHAAYGDAVSGEERLGALPERDRGGSFLVGEDLAVGQAGVVVDGAVDKAVATR